MLNLSIFIYSIYICILARVSRILNFALLTEKGVLAKVCYLMTLGC